VIAFFQELMHVGVYKKSQGRITRQLTFAAIALAVVIAMYQYSQSMISSSGTLRYGIPGALLLIGLWMTYRLVNLPVFADFLIAVEAEMNKVSWPTRTELLRASLVVLFTIFALAAVLATYDILWRYLFTNILKIL